MASALNAIVTHRIEVASGLIILRVAPDRWQLPEWESRRLTPRRFDLKPGDRAFLGKKISGMLTLDEVPEGQNLILVGTVPAWPPT